MPQLAHSARTVTDQERQQRVLCDLFAKSSANYRHLRIAAAPNIYDGLAPMVEISLLACSTIAAPALQPCGDKPAQQRPGGADAPAGEDIRRPVHAQIDAADADRHG